jgi:hypothetical protein
MTRKPVTGAVFVSAAALFGWGSAALAQSAAPTSTAYDAQTDYYGRGKNTSVLERDRPDFEALGIHQGGMTLFPSLSIATTYTDNVYATANHQVGDEYLTIQPSVSAQSSWGRHGLRVFASVTDNTYVTHSSEDTLGYNVRADGRIDVHGQSTVNLGAFATRGYEARGNIYALVDTLHPVKFDTQGAYIRGSYVQDRTRLTLGSDVQNFTYANAALVGGGTFVEDTRDEHLWDSYGRVDYALTPDEAVFGAVNYTRSDYTTGPSINRRSSYTTKGLGGVNFDLTAVARGEIGVGYGDRVYDSGQYKGISGVLAGVKVEYFPTPLLTVTLLAQRQPQDAAFTNSGGFFQNTVSVGADYEIRRNWIVSAAGGYEDDDFDGISRRDKVANVTVSSRYYVSRAVGVGADLSYADRSSSGTFAGPTYKNTKIGVFLVFQR